MFEKNNKVNILHALGISSIHLPIIGQFFIFQNTSRNEKEIFSFLYLEITFQKFAGFFTNVFLF